MSRRGNYQTINQEGLLELLGKRTTIYLLDGKKQYFESGILKEGPGRNLPPEYQRDRAEADFHIQRFHFDHQLQKNTIKSTPIIHGDYLVIGSKNYVFIEKDFSS